MTDAPQTPPPGAGDQPSPYQGQPGVPPVAPPAAPKRSGASRIVSIIVVVVVLAGAGFYFWNQYQQDQLLQVGNCMTVSGTADDAQVHEADCSDAETASWQIAQVIEDGTSCDSNEFAEYYVTRGSETIASYCLQPVVAADKCYTDWRTPNEFNLVDCSSSEAIFKAASVHDGTDESVCGAEEAPIVFAAINKTYCLVEA